MDLNSILSSLSEDDVKKLKSTAEQFFSAGADKKKEDKKDSTDAAAFLEGIDTKMLSNVAKFSSMMNAHDDKSDFILALKPLLSEARRKKADDAIMMMKFMKIISALQGE